MTTGVLSVSDFIAAVRNAEEKYNQLSIYEFVSCLRQLYYSDLGFQLLLPDSVGSERRYGSSPFPVLLDRKFISMLRMKADENGREDNPSPYIQMPGAPDSLVDIGHMLLTIDALRFPRTDDPYKAYKVPAIDPASWVADLAIAAYWNEVFVAEGRPGLAKARFVTLTGARDEQALVKKIFDAPTLNIATFYAWSAPLPDLLGDIDGFGLYKLATIFPTSPLFEIFQKFYTGDTAASKKRFSDFCIANEINYDRGRQDWIDYDVIDRRWTARMDRCIDLFMSDWKTVLGINFASSPAPAPKTYNASPKVLRIFMDWLKAKLQAELREVERGTHRPTGPLFPRK